MGFGKISKALAIPTEATADYAFFQFELCPAGPPTLTCRHAGDGNREWNRALWHEMNRNRNSRTRDIRSDLQMRARMQDDARRVADHCVVAWTNVYEDGDPTPTPCTPDKVHEFLCAVIAADDGTTIYGDFKTWLSTADNFRSAPVGGDGDLGKA